MCIVQARMGTCEVEGGGGGRAGVGDRDRDGGGLVFFTSDKKRKILLIPLTENGLLHPSV